MSANASDDTSKGAARPMRSHTSPSAEDRVDDFKAVTDPALSRLDLEAFLHELLARLRDRARAGSAMILLVTEERDALRVRASIGRRDDANERFVVPLDRGIAGRIVASGLPMLFDDLTGEEVTGEGLLGQAASMIGTPMKVGSTTIGAILVGATERRHFTTDDIPLIEVVADRASVALENERLRRAEERAHGRSEAAARRLGGLGALIAKLAASITEDEITSALVTDALPFLEATALWIFRLDDTRDSLRAAATQGIPPEIAEEFGLVPLAADRPSAEAVRTGIPVFVRSADELVAMYPDLASVAHRPRAGAAAALPLAAGSAPIGSMVLRWDEPRDFDDEERAVLSGLGDQVAQALERARLYGSEHALRTSAEAAAFRIKVLQDLTSALSGALTVQAAASALIERGLQAVGATAGALFMASAGRDALMLIADYGHGEETIRAFGRIQVGAEIPVATAFRSRKPILFPDIATREARFHATRHALAEDHASAAFPLVTGGDAIGAIDMTFREPRTFDPEEIEFISAVVEQGASALERARLHDGERRERMRAAFLDALGGLLARSLNFERTLAKVARLVVHGVDVGGERIDGLADRCSIALMQPDGSIGLAAIEEGDPGAEATKAPLERRRAEAETRDRAARVLRTGRSELTAAPSEDLDGHSVITVALSARGRTFGAIDFVCAESGRSYDDDDLGFAEEVAGRAATAIDNARLYRERGEIARTLQRALKPHDPPPIRGIDLATRYLAAGEGIEVGGDFYEIWEIEDEHALWVCIGDVTGKGPSAVDLNLLARHTIRAAAMRGDSPEGVLVTLNRALLDRESTDRFCTAITCRLDLSSEPLHGTIACGGHPLPMVLRVDGTLERTGAAGTLLGLFPEIELDERPFTLEIGDTMVLYTDGVIEERAGARQFGTDGLAAELVRSAGRSVDQVAEAIERAVRGVRPEGELLDDVALVVLRPTGQTRSG